MRFLRFCSVALVLLLSAVMAHAQGFQDLSFPAGPGPELKYHLLVPEGVTITNKKGEVVKGGQIVLVPGANVTILEPAYVKTQMENAEFKAGFINADNYSGISEEKTRDYAIVSNKVSRRRDYSARKIGPVSIDWHLWTGIWYILLFLRQFLNCSNF